MQQTTLLQTDPVNDNLINIQLNDDRDGDEVNGANGLKDISGTAAGGAVVGSSKIVLDTTGFLPFDKVQG